MAEYSQQNPFAPGQAKQQPQGAYPQQQQGYLPQQGGYPPPPQQPQQPYGFAPQGGLPAQPSYGYPHQGQPSFGNPYGQPPYGNPADPQLARSSPPPPFNPNILSNLDGDVATQLGLAYGTKAFSAGQDYLNNNIKRYVDIPMLKYYFDVNNSYVADKLRVILFPFTKKEWERGARNGGQGNFLTPREDLNAPDLYIPVMAFVTFVLLVGVESGHNQRFTPEVLGVTSSTALAMGFFELVLIKLGCYLLNLPSDTAFLDLIAYIGYKYVGMIVVLLASMVLGSYGFWLSFTYTSVALMFFFVRTLRSNLGSVTGTETGLSPQRRTRNYFLLAVALVQVASSYFLL